MIKNLFRGVLKADNLPYYHKGQWVYGDYVRLVDGKRIIPHIYGCGEIEPNTEGQYIGLDDKNGKEIYEDDIVAGAVTWQEKRINGVVTFRDGSFGLIWYRGEIEQFNPFTSMCNIEYEVIGNIHDNPELLKRGAE